MGPDHYHSMTDAQLAQWHQLTMRVEKLNAMLLTEQQKTARLEAELRNAAEDKARMEEDFRVDFERMAIEVREAQEVALRDRNRLTLIAQHLPTFLGDFISTYLPFKPESLTEEYRRNLQTARELLLLCEPFAT